MYSYWDYSWSVVYKVFWSVQDLHKIKFNYYWLWNEQEVIGILIPVPKLFKPFSLICKAKIEPKVTFSEIRSFLPLFISKFIPVCCLIDQSRQGNCLLLNSIKYGQRSRFFHSEKNKHKNSGYFWNQILWKKYFLFKY